MLCLILSSELLFNFAIVDNISGAHLVRRWDKQMKIVIDSDTSVETGTITGMVYGMLFTMKIHCVATAFVIV